MLGRAISSCLSAGKKLTIQGVGKFGGISFKRGLHVSSFNSAMFYDKLHSWVDVQGNTATIGITDHAQKEMGDVVYVEFSAVGQNIPLEGVLGSIESVKAVAELYSPVSGTVKQVNDFLTTSPGLVNDAPETEGWIVKLEMADPTETSSLLSKEKYLEYLATTQG